MEIEKKFLARDGFKEAAFDSVRITQGYLSSVPERTVRVRIRGDRGYITVKGPCNESGMTRFEWEKEIALGDALSLMELCQGGFIDKTRNLVPFGGHVFEVDEFYGDNDGLIMAEVELDSVDEPFEKPSWLGEEVTGDRRYYNSHLLKMPYKMWK